MNKYVIFALKGLLNSAQRQRLGIRITQSSFSRHRFADGKPVTGKWKW